VLSANAVLVCALAVLGRSGRALPPIEFVQTPPADVSARAEAFVRTGDRRIFLVTSTSVFRRAQQAPQCLSSIGPMRKLASVIVHEEWHLNHGSDERAAYAAQLTALASMGAGPNSAVYHDVKRAMLAVSSRETRDRRAAMSKPAAGFPPS
jgi:hypothetical protein